MSRRAAIQTGVCGALSLSLVDMLRLEAADNPAFTQKTGTKNEAKALSIIQLHLPGGFQQQESLDPKPEAPVAIRGSFGVTKTKAGHSVSWSPTSTESPGSSVNGGRSGIS